jgi:hypothetical protein
VALGELGKDKLYQREHPYSDRGSQASGADLLGASLASPVLGARRFPGNIPGMQKPHVGANKQDLAPHWLTSRCDVRGGLEIKAVVLIRNFKGMLFHIPL